MQGESKSIIYNGGYMIPEIITTTVGTPLLARALHRAKGSAAGI